MNIGIYGGSFDPPHLGHLNVVLHSLNNFNYDEIIVVPCFQQTGKNLTSFDQRYKMCKITFEILPKVTISCVEERLRGESITLRTIQEFKRSMQYRDANLFLIIGQDTADKISEWEGGIELLKLVKLRITSRTSISSTQIRELKRNKNKYRHLVTNETADYIRDYDLYA